MILLLAETGFHSYGALLWRMQARRRLLIVSGLLAFPKIMGMHPKEADKVCRDATAAIKNKSMHAYLPQ
jgi:hypothetical protein